MQRRLPRAISAAFPDPAGLPLPTAGIRGLRVLLSSPDPAAVHDAFIASALVGATGAVECWLEPSGGGGGQQQQQQDEPATAGRRRGNDDERQQQDAQLQRQQQQQMQMLRQLQRQILQQRRQADGDDDDEDQGDGEDDEAGRGAPMSPRAAAIGAGDGNPAGERAAGAAAAVAAAAGAAAAAGDQGGHHHESDNEGRGSPAEPQPQLTTEAAVALASQQLSDWAAELQAPQPAGNLAFHLRSPTTHPLPSEAFHLAAVTDLPVASPQRLAATLRSLHGALRPGGELFVSVLLSTRRLGRRWQQRNDGGDDEGEEEDVTAAAAEAGSGADELLEAAGVGSAVMYVGDFVRTLRGAGFAQPRVLRVEACDVVAEAEAGGGDEAAAALLMLGTKLSYFQIRAQKNRLLEPSCEDYGQWVVYRGTLEGCDEAYTLDCGHRLGRNQPALVCGNTAAMLGERGVSWLSDHFIVSGDRSVHFGAFSGGSGGLPQHHHHQQQQQQAGGGMSPLAERCCI